MKYTLKHPITYNSCTYIPPAPDVRSSGTGHVNIGDLATCTHQPTGVWHPGWACSVPCMCAFEVEDSVQTSMCTFIFNDFI